VVNNCSEQIRIWANLGCARRGITFDFDRARLLAHAEL
jgi:hypothetical protein